MQKNRLLKTCDFLIEHILISIAFLAPIVCSKNTTKLFSIPKEGFMQASIVALVCIWLIRMFQKGRLEVRKTGINLVILLFILVHILSFVNIGTEYSPLLKSSLRLGMEDMWRNLLFFLFFFAATSSIKSPTTIKKIVLAMVFSATINSAYALTQAMGKEILFTDIQESGRKKVFGLQGNPNFLAGFLVIVLPLTLLLIFSQNTFEMIRLYRKGNSAENTGEKKRFFQEIQRRFFNRDGIVSLFGVVSFIMILTTVFATRTRTCMAAAVFAILVFIVLSGYARLISGKKVMIFLGTVILIVAMVFLSSSSLQIRVKQAMDVKQESTGQRLLMWMVCTEMFRDNPLFGVGIGQFKQVYFHYQQKTLQKFPQFNWAAVSPIRAHQEYLQYAAELGFFGLVCFLWMMTLAVMKALHLIRTSNKNQRIFAIVFCACLGAVMVDSLAAFPFKRPEVAMTFWVVMSLLFADERIYRKWGELENSEECLPAPEDEGIEMENLEKEKPFSQTRLVQQGMVLILSVFILFIIFRVLWGNVYLKWGLNLMQRGSRISAKDNGAIRTAILEKAKSKFEKSASFDSGFGETHFRWAQTLEQMGNFEEALKRYKISLLNIQSKFTYFAYGYLYENMAAKYQQMNDIKNMNICLENAKEGYTRLVSLFPNFVKAIHRLALLRYREIQMNFYEAENKQNQVLQLADKKEDFHLLLDEVEGLFNLGIASSEQLLSMLAKGNETKELNYKELGFTDDILLLYSISYDVGVKLLKRQDFYLNLGYKIKQNQNNKDNGILESLKKQEEESISTAIKIFRMGVDIQKYIPLVQRKISIESILVQVYLQRQNFTGTDEIINKTLEWKPDDSNLLTLKKKVESVKAQIIELQKQNQEKNNK